MKEINSHSTESENLLLHLLVWLRIVPFNLPCDSVRAVIPFLEAKGVWFALFNIFFSDSLFFLHLKLDAASEFASDRGIAEHLGEKAV